MNTADTAERHAPLVQAERERFARSNQALMDGGQRSGRARALTLVGCCSALLIAACSGSGPKPINSPTAGLSCIDDSPGCVAKRQKTLRHLMTSPDRQWMRTPPDAAAYASGVRLFAYKRQKSQLSCPELKSALQEARSAPSALKAAKTPITPAQASRSKMFAKEVGRELKRELRRRCRG